ncbi:hypothetical protein [Asticcacaulis tiandongensis]|uniref:hypothetical protein n=1 Tax=Asticcacaulis tiandongensis TaxID=2565365 RepID=UPI001126A77D|nr:hypothetical protein [Asticcacaulis tiandongensis]
MKQMISIAGLMVLMATGAAAATPQQVANGFVEGVGVCLEASLLGVKVSALPPAYSKLIRKGDEAGRFLVSATNPDGPIWDVKSAAGQVIISEAADGDCEVVTYGAPVESTFKSALNVIQKRDSRFIDAGDKPDSYTPIRYGLVAEAEDSKIHIVLQGAEPGTAPQRRFRFSTLSARILRTQP